MAHLLWPSDLQNDVVVRILSDPTSRDRFLDFCQGVEFSPENAWFPLAVAQYRASPNWSEAAVIHELFIPQSAPYTVNLTAQVRFTVERDFAAKQHYVLPPQRIFDVALGEIVKLLRRDAYKRFTLDKRVGLAGIANGQVRTFHTHRANHAAKASLKQYDAKMARTAQVVQSGSFNAIGDSPEKREYAKRLLRSAQFDLSFMGLE